MPIFNFKCDKCSKESRKILPKRPEAAPQCTDCGGNQSYVSNLHTIVLETFDDGWMPKKVYRLRDIEQLKKDRQEDFEKLKTKDEQGIV